MSSSFDFRNVTFAGVQDVLAQTERQKQERVVSTRRIICALNALIPPGAFYERSDLADTVRQIQRDFKKRPVAHSTTDKELSRCKNEGLLNYQSFRGESGDFTHRVKKITDLAPKTTDYNEVMKTWYLATQHNEHRVTTLIGRRVRGMMLELASELHPDWRNAYWDEKLVSHYPMEKRSDDEPIMQAIRKLVWLRKQ